MKKRPPPRGAPVRGLRPRKVVRKRRRLRNPFRFKTNPLKRIGRWFSGLWSRITGRRAGASELGSPRASLPPNDSLSWAVKWRRRLWRFFKWSALVMTVR